MNDILSGNKILVTGATGLLGNAFCKMLLTQGHSVRAMARNPHCATDLAKLGAEVVQANMTDPSSLDRAAAGCQVVFHFAGALAGDSMDPEYYRQVNVEGAVYLAQAALRNNVRRFLHTSSAWVYGYAAAPGTIETSPYLISNDPYIDTKIEAEQQLQKLRKEGGLPLVIIQPSEVYGPADRHWTLIPLRYIKSGVMVMVNGGSGIIHPIYVDDVVEGTLSAVRLGRIGEAYILCGPEPMPFKRYYYELAHMLGRKWIPSIPYWMGILMSTSMEGLSKITHKPPLFSRPLLRSNSMVASYDGSKARQELGFTPKTSLEEGMAKVAAWLETEKPLELK